MPNREVAELIWEAEQDGRIAQPWSAEIKRDMAGRVLGTLSDFGLLEEFKPATRRIAAYRAADGTVLYSVPTVGRRRRKRPESVAKAFLLRCMARQFPDEACRRCAEGVSNDLVDVTVACHAENIAPGRCHDRASEGAARVPRP